MRRHDGCAPDLARWRGFLLWLDERLNDAVAEYERTFGICTDKQMAQAFNDLFRLGASPARGSGDPDYGGHAMPVAYALQFATENVGTALRALDALYRRADICPPRHILDIGSGLDAVCFALEASCMACYVEHTACLEPSTSMRALAQLIPCTIERGHYPNNMEDIPDILSGIPYFDAVCLCYAFQYKHERKDQRFFNRLAESIVRSLNRNGYVLVCGPRAKSGATDKFRHSLEGRPEVHVVDLTERGPEHLRQNHLMPKMTEMKRQRVRSCNYLLDNRAFKRLFWGGDVKRVFTYSGFDDTVLFAAVKRG